MKQFSDFPRVSLGILPTPLYRLPNISEAMGKNIYIKRDDLTGARRAQQGAQAGILIADAHGCRAATICFTSRRRAEQPRHADRRML